MMIAIVQFNLSSTLTLDQAHALFKQKSAQYQNLPGLIRKYFLLAENGSSIGGVYLWETRQDAEDFYNDGFKHLISTQFGCEPKITYFEVPIIVDNTVHSLAHNIAENLAACTTVTS